jgi:hypothetical protein
MFGRVMPYLLFANEGLWRGATGAAAGANRQGRLLLRGLQIAGAASYANILLCWVIAAPFWFWIVPFLIVLAMKRLLFAAHIYVVRMSRNGRAAFWLLQMAADVAYTAGLVQGFWILLRNSKREIS